MQHENTQVQKHPVFIHQVMQHAEYVSGSSSNSNKRLTSKSTDNKASKEHLALSSYIKDIHRQLRHNAKVDGWEETWSQHCKDHVMLRKYADCMKILACNHWQENAQKQNTRAQSRITWVHQKCQDYFFEGIFKARLQEEEIARKCDWEIKSNVLERTGKLQLLDVGSCYNPFQQFQDYTVTAIDIAPSSEDVKQCDFLNAVIQDKASKEDNSSQLLYKESFDVVVFSLLLDYFPAPELRLQCCEKAYELLKNEGILIIISPDAKHVGSNAKYMKSWRFILANIGLRRINYEKLPYLHCMLFRKCPNPKVAQRWATLHPDAKVFEKMNIPQDFNEHI